MRKVMWFSAAAILTALAGMATAAPQADNVKNLGKDSAEFKNDRVHAAVDWACLAQHPKERWTFLEVWLMPASRKPIGIRRGDFSLVLPDGSSLVVPGREELTAGLPDIRRLLTATYVPRERTSGAFWPRRYTRKFGFHEESGTLRLAFYSCTIDDQSAAYGEIYFENPLGSWPAGTYILEIRNGDIDIAIPFTL